jgi:amyloid beta precursor protein binding protein 1
VRHVVPGDYEEEYGGSEGFHQRLGCCLQQHSSWQWLLALRAADEFRAQFGHYPGAHDASLDEDLGQLRELLAAAVTRVQGVDAVETAISVDDLAREMCRFGASELHSIGAFMGGVVAQEVIKLITNQYVPACNTYLYNGMTGDGLTARL